MSQQQAEVSAAALAEAGRQAQVALKRQVAADVARAWALLDLTHVAASWDRWVAAMGAILNHYHAQSADAAALLYRATRQLELGEPGSAVLASPPSPEWVNNALGYSAPGVFDIQSRRGVEPQVAERAALTKTMGTSVRIAMDGSRTTTLLSVVADPARVRYYRLTDDNPCAFCALLASRGAVYHSEDSAAHVVGSGSREIGELYHDDCGCTVVASFSNHKGKLTVPAQEANDLYYAPGMSDLPTKERLAAFRKAWNKRERKPAEQAA